MTPPVDRPPYDDTGSRLATCTRCGMAWFESREPIELLPGYWSGSGERDHTCPEPMPYLQAVAFANMAAAQGGIVVHPRVKAAVKLGLEAGDPGA